MSDTVYIREFFTCKTRTCGIIVWQLQRKCNICMYITFCSINIADIIKLPNSIRFNMSLQYILYMSKPEHV